MKEQKRILFMKKTEIKFFDVLQEKLKGQNISEVARQLNISIQLLHDWSSAKRNPSLKNIDAIKKLATYFDMSLEEFILGNETHPKESLITSISFKDQDREYVVQVKRIR